MARLLLLVDEPAKAQVGALPRPANAESPALAMGYRVAREDGNVVDKRVEILNAKEWLEEAGPSGRNADELETSLDIRLEPDEGEPAEALHRKSVVRIAVGRDRAIIGVEDDDWNDLGPAVMLALAQRWRLCECLQALDGLSDELRAELTRTRPRQAKKASFSKTEDRFRALMVELPTYQAPLDDPGAFLTTKRQIRAYREVARKLRLPRISAVLDRRVDYLDPSFFAIAERHRHRHIFAAEVVLEVLIVILLLVDLAVRLYELLHD